MSDDLSIAIADSEPDFAMRRREPEQPSLFAIEDLVVPPAVRELRKPISAIHAIMVDRSPTLNGLRLLDACILVAQIDFRSRGDPRAYMNRVRTDRVCPMFETHITDLARLANIPGKNYERLYKELDELFEAVLTWNILGDDAGVEWNMRAHFLASLGYGNGKKRGLVRFSIVPELLEILLEPKNWATLSCPAMGELKTAPSYALYQNAFRYVNTNAKVTAALPVTVWIELLMGKSRYVATSKDGSKRAVNYGDFKRRVLLDAIRRVNDNPRLSYTLKLHEIKSGQRVVKLQFRFEPKNQPALGLPLTWPADLITLLEGIGFTPSEQEDLSQSHSIEEVIEGLTRLEASAERLRKAGKAITARKNYFLGILANISQGTPAKDIDHDKIMAEAQLQEEQSAAAARQQKLSDEFRSHQTARVSEWFFALPEPERAALLEKFWGSRFGQSARLLARKGWTPSNIGALSALKGWLQAEQADLLEQQVLAHPEDRTLEAWMAWRLDLLG